MYVARVCVPYILEMFIRKKHRMAQKLNTMKMMTDDHGRRGKASRSGSLRVRALCMSFRPGEVSARVEAATSLTLSGDANDSVGVNAHPFLPSLCDRPNLSKRSQARTVTPQHLLFAPFFSGLASRANAS